MKEKKILQRILFAFLSILLLTSCGSKAIIQTNESAHFSVTMTLDAPAPGARRIDLRIKDKAGADVEIDQLILAPVMRDMGMASPEMTAQRIAVGQYRITGEPFSMTGIWELDLRIVAQGHEDATTFKVEIK